jgi:ABC-type multidrug transport system fused ATPase/permease subunit
MLVSSLLEIVSIGSVVPLIAVLSDIDLINHYEFIKKFLHILNISGEQNIKLFVVLSFSLLVILSSTCRLTLVLLQSRVGYKIGSTLGASIFSNVLNLRYDNFVKINSSEILVGVTQKTNAVIGSTVIPFMNIISSGIMLCCAVTILALIDFTTTLLVFTFFSFIYLWVIHFNKKKIRFNSQLISRLSNSRLKTVQEALGGFRDVSLSGLAGSYIKQFLNFDKAIRTAQASNQVRAETPRYGIEGSGILLIVWFVFYFVNSGGDMKDILPSLGLLVLGIQRLLPIMQKGFASWTQLKGEQDSLNDVIDLLRKQNNTDGLTLKKPSQQLDFTSGLSLSRVCYRYSNNGEAILRDIDITIMKGEIVGIVGESGAGKSTLVDLIMGLLCPTSGELKIGNVLLDESNRANWWAQVAHVPQKLFLLDASIAENIAFGEDRYAIDMKKLDACIRIAQLESLIAKLPNGIYQNVGERGVKLSGGQIQRVGLARALYKKAELLVLDEATSALDTETETRIIEEIKVLSHETTVVMVAHRLTTLTNCSRIILVTRNSIKEFKNVKSYSEYISKKPIEGRNI